MNFRRLPFIALALVSALVVTGCAYMENPFTRHRVYRKVHITDLEGHLVADWIAEGPVWSDSPGYRFRAMERRNGGPIQLVTRYPNGRNVKVSGPVVVVMPCEKPQWLVDLDHF